MQTGSPLWMEAQVTCMKKHKRRLPCSMCRNIIAKKQEQELAAIAHERNEE